MKEKLTNNLSLKILSLIVAILVWLLVINVDNPIVKRSFVVTDVQLLNEAYIDADGKMCMRDDEQEPIRVTVKAQRKVLDDLSVMDIRAVADLQQAVSLDTNPVMVPISVTIGRIPSENIQVNPQNLSLHIEDKETQEFVVNVAVGNNSKPEKGYEIGTLESSPEKIRITGPTSLINKIDKVTASIDVNGATSDVVKEREVTVIDKNGEEFSAQDMSYLNVSKVYVTARLWKVRTDVKISAECSGTPADGYQVESVTTTPNVISVSGSDEALAALAEQGNIVSIPAEVIDISGKSKDYEEKVKISDYLPEGLKLINDSSADVFVHVNILPEGSTVCEIPTKNIKVEDMPDGMQVTFDAAQIEVRVKKTEEDLENLNEKEIKASINLKDTEEGVYEIPVDISIPNGYELVDEVTADIEVSKISKAEENS